MARERTAAKRLFRWIATILPFDFRRDYGTEMERAFADDLDNPSDGQQSSGTWMTLLRAIAGLGPVALREHRRLRGRTSATRSACSPDSAGSRSPRSSRSPSASVQRPPRSASWIRFFSGRCRLPIRIVWSRCTPSISGTPASTRCRIPTISSTNAASEGLPRLTAYTFTPLSVSTGGEPQQVLAGIVVRQLLQRARCLCSARPRHRAVRCSCRGPAAGGGAFRRVLEAALRRESGSRRPDDSTERHGVHGDRRDAARVHRHRHRPSRRSLGADDRRIPRSSQTRPTC